MKPSIKHHYVPKFYLKNFCVQNSSKIYCYDKVKDYSYLTNINDIGHENLFYGLKGIAIDEFEKAIGRLESKFFAPNYNEVIRLKNITRTPRKVKGWFFFFLTYQMIRTKRMRMELRDIYKKIAAELRKEQLGEDLEDFVSDIEDNIDDENYIKALHIIFWLSPPYNNLRDMSNAFGYKKWVILKSTHDSLLWSSDSPISFHNDFDYEGNLGILSKGVEIRFPLTSNLLLFSYDENTHPIKKNNQEMSNEEIKYSNIYQIKSSTRFIYSSTGDFSLARGFLDSFPKYRDPNRRRSKIFTNKELDLIEQIKLE